MSKPIYDKAEVSIDFPDKFYHGSFSRSSRYNVATDNDGVHISFDRADGEKRHVGFHIHHHLFSDILTAIAEAIDPASLTTSQREDLVGAAQSLVKSLNDADPAGKDK